jgi:hypothetical protein
VTAIHTNRNRATAPIAALLFLCQVLAGVAAPLAHAQEPERAPAAFEAHHDASCLVLHDAMRCALCQYAGGLGAPLRPPVVPARAAIHAPRTPLDPQWHPRDRIDRGSRPRAPPAPLS